MAGSRITEEQKEQINRLYYECGVKAQVARQLGISASSVSKYIIPGWQPPEVVAEGIEEILERKNIEPKGSFDFVLAVSAADNPIKAFCDFCKITDEEWNEMKAVQAEFVTI